jgi:release factor glutamine methyltransferase
MTTTEWLQQATRDLMQRAIPTARLDAELILSHTLRRPRTWLHAHNEDTLDIRQIEIANARLDLRKDRVPVAYIIGHKEFYGRHFTVTTATLIPRPESEAIIELLGTLSLHDGMQLVDVGTGTGCLGITAKLEYPELSVSLVDIDKHALAVAKKNASQLNAEVEFYQSDLLQSYPYGADIIVANLPYVDREWDVSPETTHEPSIALFAEDNGMRLIKELFLQARTKLKKNGFIFIESDVRQHHALNHFAEQQGFSLMATQGLITLYTSV